LSRRAAVLAAAALAAACNQGSTSPSLRLQQPTGVALFHGYTDRTASQSVPYVAIANSGNDELVLVDAVGDEAVASSIAIRPLSVPIPSPRPALVAAVRLDDDDPSKTDVHGDVMTRPDLLVAVSSGSTRLQLVRTWTQALVPIPSVWDEQVVELGRPVQAIAAVPAINGDGTIAPQQAWVVVALEPASGQGTDLAVVQYARIGASDPLFGTEPDAIRPTALTVTAVQHLAFEVRSLGVDPSATVTRSSTGAAQDVTPLNPRYLYAASGDPIPDAGGVLGVAELDMAGGAGAFAVRGLDARAPTTLVAGFTLAERNVDQSGSYDQLAALPVDSASGCVKGDLSQDVVLTCPRTAFQQANGALIQKRRVYATLDPASCGTSQPMNCGVVVLDPDTAPSPRFGHLLANPFLGASADRVDPDGKWSRAHDDAAEPFLPPIAYPGSALALIPLPPPANAPYGDRTYEQAPFGVVAPLSTPRLSTGALAILTGGGKTYLLDPSRWELLSDPFMLRTTSSLAVTNYTTGVVSQPQIGFYAYASATAPNYVLVPDRLAATFALSRDPAAGAYIQSALTLGYTPDETWTVAYQGYLPGLDVPRPALVEGAGPSGAHVDDQVRVSLQAARPDGMPTQVFRVYDPTSGIRVGDIVQLWTHGEGGSCPDTSLSTDTVTVEPAEGKVLALLAPDSAHPGGSLVLGSPDPVVISKGGRTPVTTDALALWAGCAKALEGGSVAVRVRARGCDPADPACVQDPTALTTHHEFVVSGLGIVGYAGRVVENSDADANGATPHTFTLRTQDETPLACPLVPWPADPASVVCDDACRQQCEALVLARKARRISTVSVRCSPTEDTCNTAFPDFNVRTPQNTVDVARVVQPSGPVLTFRLGVDYVGKLDPDGNQKLLVRDTVIKFGTRSGFDPSSRFGSAFSGGTGIQPSAGVAFDRSRDPGWGKVADGQRLFIPYLDGTLIDTAAALGNAATKQMR
jgi:hypothetical protein